MIVKYKIKDRIGTITLNRPEKRNALSTKMVDALHDAFQEMEISSSVKVVVLQSKGDVFCAGADLKDLQGLQDNSYDDNLSDSNKLRRLLKKIYKFPKPVIAKVQGHAIAGGCGLVTVCDFAFTVPEARFGYTEVKIGFVPALVLVFLLRKIGEARANELLLTGKLITAEKACSVGLINDVVKASELTDIVYNFARELIRNNSESSMRMTKSMIKEVQEMSLDEALKFTSEMNAKTRSSADCKKGIAAFLNKEKIVW